MVSSYGMNNLIAGSLSQQQVQATKLQVRSVGVDNPYSVEIENGKYVALNNGSDKQQNNLDNSRPSPHLHPPSFDEITNPAIKLSPLDFAKLQEEVSKNDRSLEANAKLNQSFVKSKSSNIYGNRLDENKLTYDLEEGSDGIFYAANNSYESPKNNYPSDEYKPVINIEHGATIYSQTIFSAQQTIVDLIG